MAVTSTVNPGDYSPPLENLTNEAHRARSAPSKSLRRTRSSRALFHCLDSSESVPDFNSSIWDADIACSGDRATENSPSSPDISPTTSRHPQADPFPSFSVVQTSSLPANLPFQTPSNTDFQPTQLEPIAEQRTLTSSGPSFARTRLSQSPARRVNIVHPQQSLQSIHVSQRQIPPLLPNTSLPTRPYRRRAFSLDDLDCLKFPSLDCFVRSTRSSISSSSDPELLASFGERYSQLAEPQQPSYPGPERTPTPPGVPSFGSPDAVNFFNQPPARFSSWWRIGRPTQPVPSFPDTSVAAAALAGNLSSPSSQAARPSGLLHRFILFNIDFSSSPWTTQPRRASLPAGVLRADDGTFVRGRFGGRVSGHGISSRGLDSHPIQRAVSAAGGERKDAPAEGGGCIRSVGQPESIAQSQGHQDTVMSGAVHRPASISSRLTTLFSWESRATERWREEVAASREEVGRPQTAVPQEAVAQAQPAAMLQHQPTTPHEAQASIVVIGDDLAVGLNELLHPDSDNRAISLTRQTPLENNDDDLAAGTSEFLYRTTTNSTIRPAPQNSLENNENGNHAATRPPSANENADNENATAHTTPSPSTSTPAPQKEKESESGLWHCIHWFCICCCEMTDKEWDGGGWYGADRPWLRSAARRKRREEERERGRREESRERRDERDIERWRVEREMQARREESSRRERRRTNESLGWCGSGGGGEGNVVGSGSGSGGGGGSGPADGQVWTTQGQEGQGVLGMRYRPGGSRG
ncbi:hypothetical protein EPUS_08977 [Endocarpon pusillum Z07020]|uniref:Uncharacterized protein n=1 Tax=Endocarpon pusillum (strain Z07020 / HMAS-L-300199) TaxID=1263415 RepID=U1GGJ3_ENDPU|nr:uncharacterized protein EPUS_08977 [Endocarpon pusillum Z07020]ERF76792.1 hypothetical protein EPUS_08977 [Endocarpon pusillum Z07020]